MKNVKLNLKKTAKAGFSLVEMLVVIAIIGIIAAIAIPNIGSINQAATDASIDRNAQNCASVWNAAVAAGFDGTSAADAAAAVTLLEGTTVVGTGPFSSNTFTTGEIDDAIEADVVAKLTLNADGSLIYNK